MASRVGKYLLFETLGEGAFGKVKLGVHEESGEQVAVKIMDKSDIKAQEMTMNVRREIAIMKALKHRNIVNLRQVLTSQSKLYIVMDLVTGGELFTKILNEGKLEETIARRYFQQLVDGIEYCHRRGVCHRDLKPENLLIDETTGELKITDFGLSAMKGASTTEELLHTQCGSPNYCAPEIIARHKQGYNGNKVDAWSCGIILFALLAGFLPFYDENTKVLYRMIQRDDVKFPRKFPPEAKDLVLRLLHKEPESRYTLAEVKKHPWFAVDYEGDDSVPKSTGSGASPPASRRRRRGHSRKSSVDHAPRSRESVPRRKSDKSDNDSGSSMLPAIPPTVGQPLPPPIAIDSGPRFVPSSQRPPAPPSISPPPPRSPLPPRPPQPQPTTSVTVQPAVPSPHVPLPPPPPPTISPPPISSYANQASGRPAPPYPATGIVRRKSRESRESQPNDVGSASSGYSSNTAAMGNNGITSNAVPSYSSLSEFGGSSHVPTPPPFPAPELHTERLDPKRYPGKPSGGSGLVPNGAPPPPPATFPPPPRPMDTGSTVERSALPSASSNAVPGAIRGAGMVASSLQSTAPRAVSGAPPSVVPEVRNAPPMEEKTSPVQPSLSPPRSVRPRWTVSGPTPPPSYASTTMAPVMTPSALASGDASWLKSSRATKEEKAQGGVGVKFDLKKQDEEKVTVAAEPESKPLSIVERNRLLYNKLATDSPPPLPHSALRTSSFKSEASSTVRLEPKSAPSQKFEDRAEAPVIARYPTPKVDRIPDQYVATSPPPGNGSMFGRDAGSDVSHSLSPGAYARSDAASSLGNEPGYVSAPTGIVDLPDGDDEVVDEESRVEHVGDTTGTIQLGSGVSVREEDDSVAVPLKQRLAAALARYRRIFRLGNSIGITTSPSFSSNKGSAISEGSGEDEMKKGASRAEFFARAKAITGAWGIILTQELEEDSDSEDDAQQVTEAELQAFSRLLDFWDNRRASATIPKDGEVVLDDEDSSPLSEEDILSIQSLLQKLEPKEVEEEMTEVVEDGDEVGVQERTGDPSPIGASNIDSLEDLEVEDIRMGPVDEMTAHSSERSAPSDVSSGVPSYISESDRPRYSIPAHSALPPRAVPPPPPPPPPLPKSLPRAPKIPAPPPPPAPSRMPAVGKVATWDRGATAGNIPKSSPPPPPPPPPSRPRAGLQQTTGPKAPPPPPPPPYAAPVSPNVVTENRRMVVTQSTVRDPFRPRAPPSYPPPQARSNGPGTVVDDRHDSDANVLIETTAALQRGARIPERQSHETDLEARKRKSSTNASDPDIESRKTVSRDSGRMHSGASGASDGSGGGGAPRRGHMRSPSKDEHATRGMFAFGMFNRRKSFAMTSFDSKLSPDRCLQEIGGVLTSMGCEVMKKRGERKMKCEVPMNEAEKLLISITCTQERKVSTIQFKKGKKDRSQVDAREFYEFFQTVRGRFLDKVASGGRMQ